MQTEVGGLSRFRLLMNRGVHNNEIEVTEAEFTAAISNLDIRRTSWGDVDEYFHNVGGRKEVIGVATLGENARFL